MDTSMSSSNGGYEDSRTLQLALELSMLGLSSSNSSTNLNNSTNSQRPSSPPSFLNNHGQHNLESPSTNGYSSLLDGNGLYDNLLSPSSLDDTFRYSGFLTKKSQNMTECVPVPSSEHVAEIVGRQGCKIKALRAKTNTYIKTPVRGEEPVFVVTGRKEDVGLAKREILSAADHFSQIRASRKSPPSPLSSSSSPSEHSILAPPPAPGQVTIQVRVPYRVVGLVVGPRGATIKRIQQQTHTYIVTPSREKDPVFEVTGLPENVETARGEIEAHIAIRTGSLPLENGLSSSPISDSPPDFSQSSLLASLYKNGLYGLEGLGFGPLHSLSTSLSSGLNGGGGGGNTVGSSSSGGGSLSSLSSSNGPSVGLGVLNSNLLSDVNFSLFDSKWSDSGILTSTPHHHHHGVVSSSSSSDESFTQGGADTNSKFRELFGVQSQLFGGSGRSSLWASFERDEGIGESPTSETGPHLEGSGFKPINSPPPSLTAPLST